MTGMFKRFLLLFLFIITFSVLGEPLDIIVMIDTSSSMEPYFDNLVNYLFINTISNNMYMGDRFHLLCFSSYPTIELAETLKDEDSIKYIQKEINFLKGRLIFGRYTDLLSALQLVITYAETLKTSGNKRILLLSDGIHDPPPDSPYAGISITAARREVEKYVQQIIDKNGWSIRILRMPEKSVPGNIPGDTRGTGSPDSVFNSDYFRNKTGLINELDNKTTRQAGTYPPGSTPAGAKSPYPKVLQPGITGDTYQQQQTGKSTIQSVTSERVTLKPGKSVTGEKITTEPGQSSGETLAPGATPGKSQGINLFDNLIKDNVNVDIIDFEQNNNRELPHVTIGFPKLIFPGNLGEQAKEFSIPFVIESFQDNAITIELNRIEDDKGMVLVQGKKTIKVLPGLLANFKVKIRVPDYIPYGPVDLSIRLFFDDDHRISPREGVISFTYVPPLLRRLGTFVTENLYTVLLILLGIVLLLFIILIIKHLFSALSFSNYFKPAPWVKNKKNPYKDMENLIEMHVSMQNSHIGFRNIHKIEENSVFAIGGKRSAYLIFLVPMPANIAFITKRNGEFVFIPKKMDFFPDLASSVPDCLNKTIKVVSAKGYEMNITFSHYLSPLAEINKLLHCINGIK